MTTVIKTINDIPKKWRDQIAAARGGTDRTVRKLRDDAYYAHLDGRDQQARKFNRYADVIERTAKGA
jgi:hypothetical protein